MYTYEYEMNGFRVIFSSKARLELSEHTKMMLDGIFNNNFFYHNVISQIHFYLNSCDHIRLVDNSWDRDENCYIFKLEKR